MQYLNLSPLIYVLLCVPHTSMNGDDESTKTNLHTTTFIKAHSEIRDKIVQDVCHHPFNSDEAQCKELKLKLTEPVRPQLKSWGDEYTAATTEQERESIFERIRHLIGTHLGEAERQKRISCGWDREAQARYLAYKDIGYSLFHHRGMILGCKYIEKYIDPACQERGYAETLRKRAQHHILKWEDRRDRKISEWKTKIIEEREKINAELSKILLLSKPQADASGGDKAMETNAYVVLKTSSEMRDKLIRDVCIDPFRPEERTPLEVAFQVMVENRPFTPEDPKLKESKLKLVEDVLPQLKALGDQYMKAAVSEESFKDKIIIDRIPWFLNKYRKAANRNQLEQCRKGTIRKALSLVGIDRESDECRQAQARYLAHQNLSFTFESLHTLIYDLEAIEKQLDCANQDLDLAEKLCKKAERRIKKWEDRFENVFCNTIQQYEQKIKEKQRRIHEELVKLKLVSDK